MESRQEHFSLDRLMSLCYGNTASSQEENAHMRSCKDCESLFQGIIKQQRARAKQAALKMRRTLQTTA